jgi:hypothetical protein
MASDAGALFRIGALLWRLTVTPRLSIKWRSEDLSF